MKFLCPSCKAKYQIGDEKVAGRSVRMKCRKCGYVIQVSSVPGLGDALPGSEPPPAPIDALSDVSAARTTGGRCHARSSPALPRRQRRGPRRLRSPKSAPSAASTPTPASARVCSCASAATPASSGAAARGEEDPRHRRPSSAPKPAFAPTAPTRRAPSAPGSAAAPPSRRRPSLRRRNRHRRRAGAPLGSQEREAHDSGRRAGADACDGSAAGGGTEAHRDRRQARCASSRRVSRGRGRRAHAHRGRGRARGRIFARRRRRE